MRIHSIRVSNASSVCQDWEIDFNKGKLHDGFVFLLRGDPQKLKKLLLESIALAFFGRIHKEEVEFWDEKSSSEVLFETHTGVFSVSWSGVYHCLRDRSGRIISQSPSDVGNAVERLTGLNRQTLVRAIFPPFEEISDFLAGETSSIDNLLVNELNNNLLPLTKEVIRQKEAFIAASQKVLDSLNSAENPDETKLQHELDILQREISSLERDISKNRQAVNWLDEQNSIKEELNKLNQKRSNISAELARFEVKREILDKANRALLIEPLFLELSEVREKSTDISKSLSELVKNSSHLAERVRVAQKAFDEAEKRFKATSEESNAVVAQAKKAIFLKKEIQSLQEEIDQKQSCLGEEQNNLRRLQEEANNLKTLTSQLNKKEQHLKKKMEDLSSDSLLVDSYAEFESQLNEIDQQTTLINESEEKRKSIQKQLDNSKTILLDIQNELSSLKNDELLSHGELSAKEKSLVKLLSFVPIEDIQKEYESLKTKNEKIGHLLELNDQLTDLFEKQAIYKAEQDKSKHDLRLATITLNAANQAFKDKIAIVEAVGKSVDFQEYIQSFEEHRKKLINGKPCPLCGAIHHPFQTKLPFDGKISEQLAEAQQDLAEAQAQARTAEKTSHDVQVKYENAIKRSKEIDELIEKVRQEILSLGSSLEIAGLREKKTVTWGGVIRQKATSLAAKQEDLKNKIEKIQSLTISIEESREQVQKLGQKILENRSRFSTLENENKENSLKVQELTRIEKEATYHKSELILMLERAFIRFGIKASTPALLRQNLPILAKRREQWLNWIKESQDISKQIKATDIELERNASQLVTEKAAAEKLDKEVTELFEDFRRLQKELSDTTASQDPEEMVARANASATEASNQLKETQSVLFSRQQALRENQVSLDNLKHEEESLSAQLKTLGENFLKTLQKHNFPNEISFTASRIPESQRIELLNQSNLFGQQAKEIDEQIRLKNQQLQEHSSLALTKRPRSILEEEFFQMNGQLQKLTSKISRARETAAMYHNSNQRKLREKKEIDRLTKEKSIWLAVETKLSQSHIAENELVEIGYKIIAEFTQRQLHHLGYDWTVKFDNSNKPWFGISEGGQIQPPCHSSDLILEDRLVAELSMSLSMSVIASLGITPDFLIWRINIYEDPDVEKRLEECLKRLHSLGKQIGIFSVDHVPKEQDIGYVDFKTEPSGVMALVS